MISSVSLLVRGKVEYLNRKEKCHLIGLGKEQSSDETHLILSYRVAPAYCLIR